MGINRSGKTKHLLIATTKALFGGGFEKSKRDMMLDSYERNRTRQTPNIHTYSTKSRYEKVMAKFGDFLKEEYGLKYERDFRKLTTDELYACVDRYFEVQKAAGLAKSTLEVHISAMNKVLGTIEPEIKGYFTPENRARWRDGVEKGENDRYNRPDVIVENLRKIDETSAAIAGLQRLTGARIGDIKKIKIDEENQRVYIPRSKGGRDRYVYFEYFPEQFERVKEYKEVVDEALKEKKFSDIREDEYYQNLRKACRKAGEPYRGSHPFRYEWAQDRYEVISQLPQPEQERYFRHILEELGKSEEDIKGAMNRVREKDAVAEGIISEELGHSRLDISRHYLRIRAK